MLHLHRCDWHPGLDLKYFLCIKAYPKAQFLYINIEIVITT